MGNDRPPTDSQHPGVLANVPGVPIKLSVVLGILVIILTCAHWYWPDYRDTIVFLAIAITAAGTVSGTFYIGSTLRLQIEEERRKREQIPKDLAFRYLNIWNTPDTFHSSLSSHLYSPS